MYVWRLYLLGYSMLSYGSCFLFNFQTDRKYYCFITQWSPTLRPVDLSFWLRQSPFCSISLAAITLSVSEMVLSCGSLHHGCACWARAMWKQRACFSGQREAGAGWKEAVWRAVAVKGSFAAPNPVFFHSGGLVVYCSAVAAWFSTGLICHPIKTGQHWYTQSGSQWACYVLARMGEDKRKEKDRQIWRKGEHLWITGLCNKREERRRCRPDAE